MDRQMLIDRLVAKPDLSQFVAEAIENAALLNSLFEIVLTETSSIKYVCTKIIRMVSEQRPALIYPYFEDVVKWLHHKNNFIKWDGILTLSDLSVVDREDKFSAIYQEYFALIRGPQMITAANVVGNAWKIALAKPELESDLTQRLLEVPGIVYMNKGEPSPECNRLVCGRVLECFERYFDYSGNQAAMLNFAEGQLGSRRKKVAENAERFLRRHSVKKM